ncbi:MAG: hypothetical protein ACYC92_00335 [Candidatus Acidiferrales bacterium]
MKNSMSRSVAEFLRRALLVAVCGAFLGGAAYAQGGSCTVNQIRVRIGTAAQHPLAGTVNNIDLEIHFIGGTIQKAPDVNANMTWGVNSQNVVTIPLNQPVPVTKIKRIRLIYNISAGEWDMSFLRARAIGSVWNGRIAAWGSDPNPSPHRFTATYPAFGVDTVIPANACNLARMPVAGPVRLAPGVAAQNPARGSGPLLPSSRPQGMLVQQSSPALLQQARPVNAQATIQRNSSPGMVGPAQTMSATGNSGGSRALMTQAGPATAQSVVKPLQPPTSQSSKSSWQPLVQRGTGQGVIEGYVYWDGRIQHVPPANCSGLALTVSAGGTSLGTFTNNFAYIQNVGTYGVCAYAVHQVPVGQDLQVQISVKAPGAFSPEILRVGGSRSIKIIGGRCNNLPPAVPSPSALSSNWWTCGNYAYNVNFILDAGPRERFAPRAEVGVRKPSPPRQNVNMANGGARADDLNPQPYPPKSKTNTNSVARLGVQNGGVRNARLAGSSAFTLKLGAPKKGSRVKNPLAVQTDAVIVGLLQKQRQAADVVAAQMRLGIRPQGEVGLSGGQSQTMSASGGRPRTLLAGRSQSGMLVAQPPQAPAVSGSNSTTLTAQSQATRSLNGDGRVANTATGVTMRNSRPGGTLGPSQTMDAKGNLNSSMAHLQYIDTTALTCGHDPTFRILNVSGSSFPATFTPIDKYNLYTIKGCSFGGVTGKAYIYGSGSFQEYFVIKFWSDNEIDLSLDPSLSGYPDLGNLFLVIQRADGQQIQKGGFKFYAARSTVPLNTIPEQNVTPDQQQLYFSVNYTTPAADASGYAAEFSRYVDFHKDRPSGTIYLGNENLGADKQGSYGIGAAFASGAGSDYFDFSKLAPEFTTDSFQMAYWQPAASSMCGGNADTLNASIDEADGSWDPEWDGNNIRVAWQAQDCDEMELLTATRVRESQYALQVWVTGPRCLDPWTGQPDQNCIAEVKKQLGQ